MHAQNIMYASNGISGVVGLAPEIQDAINRFDETHESVSMLKSHILYLETEMGDLMRKMEEYESQIASIVALKDQIIDKKVMEII